MPESRLYKVKHLMVTRGLDALIISHRSNIFYLSNLYQLHPDNREALLFISPTKSLLYHSVFLTPEHIPANIYPLPMSPPNNLDQVMKDFFHSHYQIGFEENHLLVSEHNQFTSILNRQTLIPAGNLIEQLRMIKEPSEIKKIQRASKISTKVIDWIIQYIKRNRTTRLTEKYLAQKINQKMIDFGADSSAFPTIVAFDQNSSLPHHQPSDQPLKKDSIILLDLGCKKDGYCSDITRTFKLGKQTDRFKSIEFIVKSAYQNAFDLLNSTTKSLTASQIDQAARSLIAHHGYQKQFIHTTGHALGIDIHEIPSINSRNNLLIMPQMVITIEPGIYLEKEFGYRYENTILKKHHSASSLTCN